MKNARNQPENKQMKRKKQHQQNLMKRFAEKRREMNIFYMFDNEFGPPNSFCLFVRLEIRELAENMTYFSTFEIFSSLPKLFVAHRLSNIDGFLSIWFSKTFEMKYAKNNSISSTYKPHKVCIFVGVCSCIVNHQVVEKRKVGTQK